MPNTEVLAILVKGNKVSIFSPRPTLVCKWVKYTTGSFTVEVNETTVHNWLEVHGNITEEYAREIATFIICKLLESGWKNTPLDHYEECMWFEKEVFSLEESEVAECEWEES